MKNIYKITSLIFVIALLSCNSVNNNENKNVTVTIDYGHDISETNTVEWQNNITALECLQYIASVKTKAISKHVIVTAINDSAGIRGKMAWYYKINNIPAKKLAINQEIDPGDTISWVFTQDVCSAKVDNH